MKQLSFLLFALAGCTVMVNGKPRRIGGGPDPAPAAQATANAPAAATAQAPKSDAKPLPPGQVIKIDASIGRDPLLVSMNAVFDTTWSKVFGYGSSSPDCGMDITSRPIGSFEITKPENELTVGLVGGSNDGFVVRKGDFYWTSCDTTMEPIKEGWQPGRYDIYPVARGDGGKKTIPFELELYRPNAPIVADNAQKLVIAGKLDKPMLVEVAIKANRRKLRKQHAGDSCEDIALASSPDIALTIERPIPGLTIRPLPTVQPVTLRFEQAGTDKQRGHKYCVKLGRNHRKSDAPTYAASSEISFDSDDEGLYGISVGTPTNEEMKVTLLVYDASTKLDPMYVRPFGGEQPTLEQRWIGYQMPQLDADELGSPDNYHEAAHAAKVFAAVPKQALVYAKLKFDKDLGGGEGWPVKNEPLVLLGLQNDRATVLTADGMRLHVKSSHLVLAPDGPTELPAAPRPMATRDIGGTIAMLSPAQKKLGDAHYAQVKNRDACLDRAWEPFRRQLPSYTRPAGVDIVVYKSARTKQIEEAGDRAMVSKCGTAEAFAKKTEATRVKLAAEVEKTRAKLLAEATANLK
ncbi:MAG: hypothetical protein M4D80_18940 [Myxococcota bacterium]|nr:hypothetical protein [Myxococcota bacterium]